LGLGLKFNYKKVQTPSPICSFLLFTYPNLCSLLFSGTFVSFRFLKILLIDLYFVLSLVLILIFALVSQIFVQCDRGKPTHHQTQASKGTLIYIFLIFISFLVI
jgi:hypothetical protein